MKNVSWTVLALCLVGCPQVWVKPGASQTDFGKDKYDCLQQAQQRVSGAVVNQYGGSASNRVITNDTLFTACMNARGWTLQSQSAVQQNSAKSREAVEASIFKLQQISQAQKDICTDPQFEAYYKKAPCNPSNSSLSQLSDTSKITPTQKKELEALSPRLKQVSLDTSNWQRIYGGPKGNINAQIIDSSFEAEEKNRLSLYSGRISWGVFNTNAKTILEERKARLNQVAQPK